MIDIQANCPHCGKKLRRPDAAFCTNCGSPLLDDSGQITTTVHGGSLAKIIVQIPDEESHELFLSQTITTVGRSRESMIQVLSPIVSGKHARIELTRKGHAITDLHSTNGTYVNGQRLKADIPRPLLSQDIIRFSDAMENSATLTYVAPSGFSEILDIDMPRTYQLAANTSFIGRNPEIAISLDHPAVSWYHAKVIKRADSFYTIQDLSSHNGTFFNGTQLRHYREQTLNRGDVVQIGPFNLVYQDTGTFTPFTAERNFRLEAVNLEKTFYNAAFPGLRDRAKSITVLRDLNLVVNPREFVALVGGSGTGKSTLLKALSGLSRASSGTVLVNGDDLYGNFNLYRTMMGYVPQEDIIHRNLEVEQALYYAARLRLPDATEPEISTRIKAVLVKVGMTAQATTMVRNLSGGQRKRVSIAVELLAEPWIFFLDEPTSGLDPGLEKLMMDTLRQLADEGRTIILVTHATGNIVNNCDQVAFMARGGKLAYFGPPAEATSFFGTANFADIYTRLSQIFDPDDTSAVPAAIQPEFTNVVQQLQPAQKQRDNNPILAGPLWAKHYQESSIYLTYIANRQSGEIARPITSRGRAAAGGFKAGLKQFGVLARRYGDLIRHDKVSLWILLAVMPIIGILLLIISDNATLVGHPPEGIVAILETEGIYSIATQAQTLLFMMVLSVVLLGIFAAAFEIIKEEAVYRRERMVNLKILPYFSSKFLVLNAFMLVQCLLLLIVLSLKVDFPGPGALLWAPLEYYLTLLFTAFAGVALGLFISALASSRDMVIYLVLIALFVQIVFSGAIFELTPLTQPLSWLTATRWSLEAVGASTDMERLSGLGQVRVEQEVDIGRAVQKVVEDFPSPVNFFINYTGGGLALISRWIFLLLQAVFWSGLTLWMIKRKDEI